MSPVEAEVPVGVSGEVVSPAVPVRRTPRLPLALFLAAATVTFGCLAVMQFVDPPVFFGVLVAMHAGIVLFIVSKRLLRARGVEPGACYRREYALLVPFVALMLWSFAASAGLVPEGGMWKSVVVFAYALTCLAATLWNFRALRRCALSGGRQA